MTSHVFQILEVESLQQDENVIDFNSSSNNTENENQNQPNLLFNSYLQLIQLPQIFSPWIPSNEFESYIFAQYPCLPWANDVSRKIKMDL